ncbi:MULTISPECIES: 3-hydroxyacyl-CoA dehydrogenase family protein [Streptomyces albovinaceus subgroup]|uniref:3-hydroxyacyl-CoA dehydrogenase family protein n=1 Tax=Streptomyces albovinaceus subgroup TaxID=1482558 RepID=UPI001F2015CA|nr:3-hydroxyacyl-CoA dehydrogenase family protein [Streptomyces mediolani]WSF80864.1 3-hydroxyacyl-CoA dehydrogenase family protein [Streptomyces globisporus]
MASIAASLYDEFKEPLCAPPLLQRMVEAGLLGRKTGRGFHLCDRAEGPGFRVAAEGPRPLTGRGGKRLTVPLPTPPRCPPHGSGRTASDRRPGPDLLTEGLDHSTF